MKLTIRQKEVLNWFSDSSEEKPVSPVGADVTVTLNLEKKGLLKSIQIYPKNHPYRTGESWGYEVRHYYLTDAGRNWLTK